MENFHHGTANREVVVETEAIVHEGITGITMGITMPPGQYYVCDPCYVVPNDRWDEWLEAADYTNAGRYLLAELDGLPILGIGTAYGDGEYYDQKGNAYTVDSGLIGITPTRLIPAKVVRRSSLLYSRFVTAKFQEPFKCYYDEGKIIFGRIEIDTTGDVEPFSSY